ncbi:AraC family transcriptional regulator [Cohnella sp. 56]|uniref:AraC family transcriptional regulator n=1 Tax=Cohnella sp. 56 TaxID=3113722 RepID=UPI0030EA4277
MIREANSGESRSAPSDILIARLRVYMAEHYAEDLSVERMAELVGLSPKYLGELFKKRYGQRPIDYLTELRMNRAKQYLRETNDKLRDIARSVGYSDEYYFSRKFKKAVGMAPSAYPRRGKRRFAALSATATGYLLALGIVPVAAPLHAKWSAYYYQRHASEVDVHLMPGDDNQARSLDGLIRARPDAVVGHERHLVERFLPELDQWALPWFAPERQDDWRAQLREIAAFADRTEHCEQWIAAYEYKIAGLRPRVRDIVGANTFAAVRMYGDALFLYCNCGIRDVVYRDLGLAAAYSGEQLYNKRIDLETLCGLDPDGLLLFVCPDADTRTAWLGLQHEPRWRALRAVRQARVYPLPSDPWYEYSATSVDRMADDMSLLLTGKSTSDMPNSVHGPL